MSLHFAHAMIEHMFCHMHQFKSKDSLLIWWKQICFSSNLNDNGRTFVKWSPDAEYVRCYPMPIAVKFNKDVMNDEMLIVNEIREIHCVSAEQCHWNVMIETYRMCRYNSDAKTHNSNYAFVLYYLLRGRVPYCILSLLIPHRRSFPPKSYINLNPPAPTW